MSSDISPENKPRKRFYNFRLRDGDVVARDDSDVARGDSEQTLSGISSKTLFSGYLSTNSVHGLNPHVAKATGKFMCVFSPSL